MFVVAALYKFASLPNYKDIQEPLKQVCEDNEVKGTLLLAEEGLNGTIAGTRESIDAVMAHVYSNSSFQGMEYKESKADVMPFHRMKVRLKNEIVTLGVPGIDPNKKVGTYVSPQEWNKIMEDPEVILIDTRNEYEVNMGTFKGGINPHTDTFREFPQFVEENLDPKKHKKVAMWCTGGIRCEKASSYMIEKGFETVYHLKGGILKYLEEISQEESKWEGECFVFDERVSIKHNLEIGEYVLCRSCRFPISDEDKLSDKYMEGISCPHCHDKKSEKHKLRAAARHKQVLLAQQRGEKHIGS